MDNTFELALVRNLRTKALGSCSPLAAEILEALLELSGAAHRDEVIRTVAARRKSGPPSPGLSKELVEFFEHQCQLACQAGEPGIFFLPFGQGSRRWSITPEAKTFFRSMDTLKF